MTRRNIVMCICCCWCVNTEQCSRSVAPESIEQIHKSRRREREGDKGRDKEYGDVTIGCVKCNW